MRISRTQTIPALSVYLLALATIVVTGASASEHMPPKINYQGHLTDAAGKPLTGPHDLMFRFFDSEAGGNMLWTEEHLAVPVHNGLFDVILGSTHAITADIITPPASPVESLFDVFVEISVDGETMLPRTPLTSIPYALMTHRIDGDITTAPGDLRISNEVSLHVNKIRLTTSVDESHAEMESSDEFTITKAFDKATPQLYQSLAMKKDIGGSDSLLIMGLIESDTIWFSMAATDDLSTTTKTDKSSPKLYESTVESTDGLSLTKEYDKATPILFQSHIESGEGPSITKRIDKASPLLYESTVESTDGVGLTKEYDKATPILFQSHIESGEGPSITKRIDKASPLLYESTVESTDGVGLTKEYDKATPILFQSHIESGEGPSITKRIDKASPLLYESTVESTDGVSVSKQIDKASPKLTGWGMSVQKNGAFSSDSASMEAELDTSEVRLAMNRSGSGTTQGVQIRESPTAVSMAMSHDAGSALPMEEVSFAMTRNGGGLAETVRIRESPARMGMEMIKVSSLSPGDDPADTNVQMYATNEGGFLAVSNVGGTSGDGVHVLVSDNDNTLRLRHGGANTGVYLESEPSTGGRVGINNETPSEALQVSGNICASGSIGACSDVRFKDHIHEIPAALDKVSSMRGVSFTWKQDEYPVQRFAPGRHVGFVAQEVLQVLPEVVLKGGDGYYSIDYGKLTPLLVEAVKELKSQNEELRCRIEALERTAQ